MEISETQWTLEEIKKHVKEGVRHHIECMQRSVNNYKEKLETYENENRFMESIINENKKLKAKVEKLEAQNALLMKSGSRTKNAMCYTKKSYFSKKEADKAADKFRLRVYTCPICYCFHTTSKEEKTIT